MNFSQLECFLALAETLNYTKAAKTQHMTQPNFSKTISNLEQEVGAPLFARTKRTVRLTSAGEIFKNEAAKLVTDYHTALLRTRAVSEGELGTISVGFLGTAMTGLLPKVVRQFHARYPNITLNLVDYTYSSLVDALTSDRIDLAILPDNELKTGSALETQFIYADDMCIVLGSEHPMAGESQVDLLDFKDAPFIMMDPLVSVRDNDLISSLCADQNFLPKPVYSANTLHNLLLMVACNMGVSILAQHMDHFGTEDVRFIKIRGYEQFFRVVAAWRPGRNAAIPNFLEVIENVK